MCAPNSPVNSRISLPLADLGPFFDPRHESLATTLRSGLLDPLAGTHEASTVARLLGDPLALYAHLVPEAHGGSPAGRAADPTYIDVRALVVVREALAQ